MRHVSSSDEDDRRQDAVETAAMRLLLAFFVPLTFMAVAGLWLITS